MKARFWKSATPYLFISPFFIGFAIFGAYPLGWALYLSLFHQTGLLQGANWVGLANYQSLLGDGRFWKSLANTTIYALGSIFVILPVALGLALIIDSPHIRFKQFFRLGLFLPSLTSSVVIGIMFGFIFEPTSGMLNTMLRAIHLPSVGWLVDPGWIIPSVVLVGLWNFCGVNTLYYSTGLQGISPELHEAAHIDGASRLEALFYVTLPLLRPTLLFTVILAIIGSYNLFGLPYILLAGGAGPSDSGLFMTVYLYQTSFQNFEFGYAAAIGFSMAIVMMLFSLLQLRLFGAFEDT